MLSSRVIPFLYYGGDKLCCLPKVPSWLAKRLRQTIIAWSAVEKAHNGNQSVTAFPPAQEAYRIPISNSDSSVAKTYHQIGQKFAEGPRRRVRAKRNDRGHIHLRKLLNQSGGLRRVSHLSWPSRSRNYQCPDKRSLKRIAHY